MDQLSDIVENNQNTPDSDYRKLLQRFMILFFYAKIVDMEFVFFSFVVKLSPTLSILIVNTKYWYEMIAEMKD